MKELEDYIVKLFIINWIIMPVLHYFHDADI